MGGSKHTYLIVAPFVQSKRSDNLYRVKYQVRPQRSSECDVVLSALHRLSKQFEKSNNCTLPEREPIDSIELAPEPSNSPQLEILEARV